MSDLRLDLDTIDFERLVTLGRSLIPTIAPAWTDHNVHDPGIMLMELGASIADAQVYALGHTRRDERAAYARLLDLTATGPTAARGLIWPLHADAPAGTPTPWGPRTVVEPGARVATDRASTPPFYPLHRVELTTAVLVRLATREGDETVRDWTRANSQEGATFMPFGDTPDTDRRLELVVSGTLVGTPATGAPVSIGFEIVSDPQLQPAHDNSPAGCAPVRLAATLTDGSRERPLTIEADTTAGLSRSGVLLLQPGAAIAGREGTWTISIRPTRGFARQPRLQRVALNVIAVDQIEPVSEETLSFGRDFPAQTYDLGRRGLLYPLDDATFKVLIGEGQTMREWTRSADLETAEPGERLYSVDPERERVLFGNGINGARPPAEATLRVDYRVSAGAAGNLPRGVTWTIAGVPSPFGTNSEPTGGGADAGNLASLRANARRQITTGRPIVTRADLESAALSFTDLGVSRALEAPPATRTKRFQSTRLLVVVGPQAAVEASDRRESLLWFEEIRRRIEPRLPLGQRLYVMGPRYVDLAITARLVARPQADPRAVRTAVENALRHNLAITAAPFEPQWPFGRDVTALAIKGWVRNVEGVARVAALEVAVPGADEADGSRIAIGTTALPRLRLDMSDITVERWPQGGRA